jgi:RNA 2',3'-cyclic 3'-phosphodiesterase
MDIRSFLAFELPPDIRKTLSDASDAMKRGLLNLRWVRLENIHLTLIFLGNFPSNRVDSTGDALKEICDKYAPFSIQLKGIGTFGGRRNPRVLWAGIDGELDRMGAFRDDLQIKLRAFGVKKEDRKFKPHLTLARFRKGNKPEMELPRILSEFKDISSPSCKLEELLFLKSDLKPGGAIYTKLMKWSLKGNM